MRHALRTQSMGLGFRGLSNRGALNPDPKCRGASKPGTVVLIGTETPKIQHPYKSRNPQFPFDVPCSLLLFLHYRNSTES